jgi:transcriptional regulator with XRE-family HTH domain
MNQKTGNAVKNYSSLNRRLSELMKSKGITIQGLAKKANIAVGTVQKLLTDPSCNPTIASIEAICHVFNVSIGELIGQEERMNTLNGSSVYLLDWDDLPLTLSTLQNLTEKEPKKREIIKTSCAVSKNAFALKMKDDSMLPLFPEGVILIFDPDRLPKNNSYVIAHIHDYEHVIFKQLLIDEPFRYITSINPLFKDNIIKLEPDDKIIAVLVQSQMHY